MRTYIAYFQIKSFGAAFLSSKGSHFNPLFSIIGEVNKHKETLKNDKKTFKKFTKLIKTLLNV